MKSPRLFSSFLLAAAFALVLLTLARADETTSSIKFSDPAKPGTVKIMLGRGDLRVQGADTPEVTVKSEAKTATNVPRKDGLRVLTSSSSFALNEKDNVITLDAVSDTWMRSGSSFQLTVPRGTSLVVQNSFGGDIACNDLAGDIEIHSMNGEVRLENVAGGVIADTMNGEIRASIRQLHDNKPLSFTSMNGEVVLRVPGDAKANIRFRTQNGAVLTDFPEAALVTKTEDAPTSRRQGRLVIAGGHSVLPPEARQAIEEAARVSVQAAHEAAEAVKQGIEVAREHADAARAAAEAARDRARAERDAARETADSSRNSSAPVPPVPPVPAAASIPAIPPMPAIPTVTGGKLVTGTLNGGGPEISVATMNGDVTLRKLEKK